MISSPVNSGNLAKSIGNLPNGTNNLGMVNFTDLISEVVIFCELYF